MIEEVQKIGKNEKSITEAFYLCHSLREYSPWIHDIMKLVVPLEFSCAFSLLDKIFFSF